MINKELLSTIDNQRMLDSLATNLNISSVTDNSYISKVANAFQVELTNYSLAVDKAIANGFLSTMEETLFTDFANSFGIYRKSFSNVILRPADNTAKLRVNTDTMFANLPVGAVPFRKGDILVATEAYSITAGEDIVFPTSTSEVYPHLVITLLTNDGFTINADTLSVVTTTQSDISLYVPEFILSFNNTVGLVRAEESFEDFRLRVYEATYLASNMANSLVTTITKEVPTVSFIETEDIEQGRAITVLYPYTDYLIEYGDDPSLSTYLIPMIETSLQGKVLHSNMTRVRQPTAIPLKIKFSKSKNTYPTASALNEVRLTFNKTYAKVSNVSVSTIKEVISNLLQNYNVTVDTIDVYMISTYLSEDVYELNTDESLQINTGRFLTVTAIEEY